MCRARATLFYGVFVTATDLCAAARAWHRIEPILRVLELIEARKTKGTLKFTTEGKATFADLPQELVEMVKAQVVKEETLVAEDEMVRMVGWPHSPDDCDCEYCSAAAYGRLTFAHFRECDACSDCLCEGDGLAGLYRQLLEPIAALLSSFGLALVQSTAISNEEWPWTDFEALSPLTFASSSSHGGKKAVEASASVLHDFPRDLEIFTSLDTSFFSLSPYAATPFRNFFRLFPLSTSHPSEQAKQPEKQAKKQSKQQDEGEKDEKVAKEDKTDWSVPRWEFGAGGYDECT
ncbi:hypothetical protein JCM10213_009282 [Rhodosporidiobolus nylandii]